MESDISAAIRYSEMQLRDDIELLIATTCASFITGRMTPSDFNALKSGISRVIG